jgi:hypothetical protein
MQEVSSMLLGMFCMSDSEVLLVSSSTPPFHHSPPMRFGIELKPEDIKGDQQTYDYF